MNLKNSNNTVQILAQNRFTFWIRELGNQMAGIKEEEEI